MIREVTNNITARRMAAKLCVCILLRFLHPQRPVHLAYCPSDFIPVVTLKQKRFWFVQGTKQITTQGKARNRLPNLCSFISLFVICTLGLCNKQVIAANEADCRSVSGASWWPGRFYLAGEYTIQEMCDAGLCVVGDIISPTTV